MEITAALAADLAILSEALDEADGDIADALGQLVADVRLAVRSYLGLTLMAGDSAIPLAFTAMEDHTHPDDVLSSVVMPLSEDGHRDVDSGLVVILYAARAGAFVDLAADLSWLTGRPLSEFALDQHLSVPSEPVSDGGPRSASLVNQAIGVLLARGYTPELAGLEIDTRAAAARHSRSDAATVILGTLRNDDPEQTPDAR